MVWTKKTLHIEEDTHLELKMYTVKNGLKTFDDSIKKLLSKTE